MGDVCARLRLSLPLSLIAIKDSIVLLLFLLSLEFLDRMDQVNQGEQYEHTLWSLNRGLQMAPAMPASDEDLERWMGDLQFRIVSGSVIDGVAFNIDT